MAGNIGGIVEKAQSLGAEFRVEDDGRLLVRRLSSLPADIQRALRSHKVEVVTYLTEAAVLWKGTPQEYRKLLMMREAELILAKRQLKGNDHVDWHFKNMTLDLEKKIADLRRGLAEAEEHIASVADKTTAGVGETAAPPAICQKALRDSDSTVADVSAEGVFCQVKAWAADDPKRWQRIHNALLRIYTPVWERIDSRDVLVSWAAACLALNRAKCELKRLESLRQPLSRRELDAKGGRQADVSFWGRLAHRLVAKIPEALANDAEATRVLIALVSGKHGDKD
jgi:hypothetical protein